VNDGVVDGDWEYRPLKLPPGVSRVTAAVQLSIQAEYSGWELSRVRLYSDGTRMVVLRRKRTRAGAGMPGLIV
jgi:hypothetical protein